MILKKSKEFEVLEGTDLVGISVDKESFKSILGRNTAVKEIPDSFHRGTNSNGDELNIRSFQFENAVLTTTFNKETSDTRCYVSKEDSASLPTVENDPSRFDGKYSGVQFI